MHQKISSIAQRLKLPSMCTLCGQYHHGNIAICAECQSYIPLLGSACRYCAHPLPNEDFLVCGQCCKIKPTIDLVFAACLFEEPLRTLLHEFKYQDGLYLSSFLSSLIIKALSPDAKKTECLIPVPMHPKRLHQRGYNQAAELTKQLSRQLGIPYDFFHCKKIINTPAQASLNMQQREKNLQHAFAVEPLPYKHVTLVDDLLTTGNTMNELAKTLKKQGVVQVDAWCCARAILHAN